MALSHTEAPGPPPESWAPARRVAEGLLRPVERMLAIEAASGVLLLIAAAIALIWANSPWSESYFALWHTPMGVRIGSFEFERDLHFVINEELMVVFFFVVGLEIRREIHEGELSELRRAALPLVAALGGMLAPALIYASFNAGGPASAGWGIPMATDIAFAVGVLALLGKRIAPALRILLLALAIIDDIGAILVIALFYSSGIDPSGLALMGVGIALVMAMQWSGVRTPALYVAPALVVWAGAYSSGVHPTVAGVVVGLLTPVRSWFGPEGFAHSVRTRLPSVLQGHGHERLHNLDMIGQARDEAVAPVSRLAHKLHPWVAFGIMPVFALANAGVSLRNFELGGESPFILAGIGAGLVAGKYIGVLSLSWIAVRLGLARMPTAVGWAGVNVVALVSGIGFTMALFIANLALPSGSMLETAKLAVLGSSLLAATIALIVGRFALPVPTEAVGAQSAYDAERSTED